MKSISVIAAISVVLFAMSCQKMAASNSSRAVIESKYFINGDPMDVVAGTKTNSTSFLTTANYKEFDGFEMSGMMSFMQKTERESKNDNDMESVKKKNQTQTEASETKDTSSHFKLSDDGRSVQLELKAIPGWYLEFVENSGDQKLNLKSFIVKDGKTTIKPVHYSVNPEKTAYSVIFLVTDEDDSMLMGFSFQKKTETTFVKKVVDAAKDFFYLFGKGILIGQSNKIPLKVQACGRNAEVFKSEISESIKPWIEALKNRMVIQVDFVEQCAPIFDVNVQSIQFLESRIVRISDDIMTTASVLSRSAQSQGLIVGSDMLIYKGEYKRMAKNKGRPDDKDGQPSGLREDMKANVSHEFGHMLGLGHPFESKVDSIMGYDEKITTLTDYDVKAVQALYPLATIQQKTNK